ncbi:MAG: cell division protein FtsZ [Flavobacteriales bacterium]|jgi:cell division protein FtsZ
MNEIFDIPRDMNSIIKVIGVGGGGSNAVNFMYNQGIKGVDFVVCNTDRQALDISPVPFKIQLGTTLTEGRGAGMQPEVGMNAAFENIEDLREILSKNTKMVFVTAGMGGGTGTGAAPVIAQVAKELGILTVGIVTLPFEFEGKKRRSQADEGLERLRQNVDTLLVINNEKLRTIGKSLTLSEAFQKADNILTVAAKGIAEVIADTGVINVDFNDVNTVLRNSGRALMGSAMASGEGRDFEAVKAAMNSPLLNDHDICGAKYVLLNITYGDKEVLMDEIMNITDFIQDAAGEDAEVIWGHGHDSNLGDNLAITLVATGFSTVDAVNYVLPERKLMDLDEEHKKEIVSPMSSPFESNSITDTLNQEPYLKSEEPVLVEQEIQQAPVLAEVEITGVTENTEKEEVKYDLFDDEITEEPSFVAPSLEWEVQPTEQPIFDFSSEPVQATTPSSTVQPSTEQEVIRHQLDDEADESPKSYRIQSTVLPEEIARRNEERVSKIQEITSRIQNAESIAEYESQPAYLRRNVEVKDERPSQDNNVSRFGLSGSGNGDSGLRSNSYLHDNVD